MAECLALHSCYNVAETFILKDNFINFIQHSSTCFCKRFMWKSCEPRKSYDCANFLANGLTTYLWDLLFHQQVVCLYFPFVLFVLFYPFTFRTIHSLNIWNHVVNFFYLLIQCEKLKWEIILLFLISMLYDYSFHEIQMNKYQFQNRTRKKCQFT